MRQMTQEFDFMKELNNEMLRNLTTSFGLDFLMMKDRRGGNVDTTHKLRQYQKEGKHSDIYIDAKNDLSYQNRESYDSHAYHANSNYINKGREDKKLQQANLLNDAYLSGKLRGDRQLDHTISAKEIHDDRARHLSGLDGVELANSDSNLNSTNWYVNNLKRAHSVDVFINEIVPNKQKDLRANILKKEKEYSQIAKNSAENRFKAKELYEKIQSDKEKLSTLDELMQNPEKIKKADKIARESLNKEIDKIYYRSDKFLNAAVNDMANTGVKMGMRQALGLVLAELWFEMRDFLSILFKRMKESSFKLEEIWSDIKTAFTNIVNRLKERFKDLLKTFQDGLIGGIFASITSILINTFTVTSRGAGKIIREFWQILVRVAKLIFFNPDKLSVSDLFRSALKLIALGTSTIIGVMLDSYLSTFLSFPFGSELSLFVSAFCSGILTVSLCYFIDCNSIMIKIWDFFDKFTMKSEAQLTLEYYQRVNAQLDEYLLTLAQVEFNINVKELEEFNDALEATNCEFERTHILSLEIKRRNIELPFEVGNTKSTRDWLKSCLS